MSNISPIARQDVVLSGSFGSASNSARAGFIPICLERAPLDAFEGIAVYLRSSEKKNDPATSAFTLYSAANVRLTPQRRERLIDHGAKFVYIPIGDQSRFRMQTEDSLLKTATDPSTSVSVKAEIIYETSVELMNELLAEPDLKAKSQRLDKVSRAIMTLVLNDATAFSHLFAASHHDFYTATHMVNVATWMVPLAYAMGHHDSEELNHVCQAGLLHDVGKMRIPGEILNKKGKLSDEEWAVIRQHPEMGCEYLKDFDHIHPLVLTVTREHHERIDGTGYPHGLKGDKLHPISRICGIVDSFDAMTAFRPFKERTMSVAQALRIIMDETPSKYDETVLQAWIGLLEGAKREGVLCESLTCADGNQRREFPRFPVNCPARVHALQKAGESWEEKPGLPIVAHSISRSGMGFLSQTLVKPGEDARVYMMGKGSLQRDDTGVIVRCRAYKDGWYEVGMKFAKLSELAETDLVGSVAA